MMYSVWREALTHGRQPQLTPKKLCEQGACALQPKQNALNTLCIRCERNSQAQHTAVIDFGS